MAYSMQDRFEQKRPFDAEPEIIKQLAAVGQLVMQILLVSAKPLYQFFKSAPAPSLRLAGTSLAVFVDIGRHRYPSWLAPTSLAGFVISSGAGG